MVGLDAQLRGRSGERIDDHVPGLKRELRRVEVDELHAPKVQKSPT